MAGACGVWGLVTFPLCHVSLAWAALWCFLLGRVQILGPLHDVPSSVSVLGLPEGRGQLV